MIEKEGPMSALAKNLVTLNEYCNKHPDVKLVSHQHRPDIKACRKCVEERRIEKILKFGGLPDWTTRDQQTGEIVRYEPSREDADGEVIAKGKFEQSRTSLSDILQKFKDKEGYDLTRAGVIEFAYDPQSLEKLEKFEDWLKKKFAENHKHVEIVMVNQYLNLVKSAYMSADNRQRLIDKKGNIERSDIVIVDNLGDYSPEQQSDFLSFMRMLQAKTFILLTFADADSRLERLPAAVKYAIKGNRMVIV